MRAALLYAAALCAAALATPAAPAAPAAAQDAGAAPTPRPPVQDAAEPRLVFEREVFVYRGRARRDPFMPLTAATDGPLFADVRLHMIIHSADPDLSIVSVSVAGGRRMRLRRGESVGNATVIEIGERHVVFSVMDFGVRKQEVLYLKPPREGA
jgi:hypothetical protein